ncbi:hypothetical protein [Mycolicibacterium confluentis]|uniref:Uncharacterized protein n=1 Tax=Mycolicibacterium confluentis TaxID=28047 RepID=A0A7I7Y4N5_9MYCO|nr:hypothetical protein [Mycolicibacterium confluentis]MCV7318104.1 hypothetical protein [Mycolicibacterium confluentis]ORV31198.1 hypothetical protein AWB99_12335 [Mycolicibacterium confluentis]BBZ36012.1 hypothetical protein MCNF_46170 [Mycolicibacterium confluentis]
MSQNPFDFSDFGPARQPGGTPPPAFGGAPAPHQGPPAASGGFDPWANQPPSAQSPARPNPESAFGDPGAFGQSGGQQDVFGLPGSGVAAGGALTTSGPPMIWFVIALGLAIAGFVIALAGALAGGLLATALVGWLLAGPVAIGALATYTRIDTRRRTETIYSAPAWAANLYWAVLAVCLVGIALGAWQIALWAGRL